MAQGKIRSQSSPGRRLLPAGYFGESGAGKTSLLRAGLPGLLAKRDPPIEYHYWEAVPDRPAAGLLTAVQTG
jgi:hypothetical protein